MGSRARIYSLPRPSTAWSSVDLFLFVAGAFAPDLMAAPVRNCGPGTLTLAW